MSYAGRWVGKRAALNAAWEDGRWKMEDGRWKMGYGENRGIREIRESVQFSAYFAYSAV